MPEVRSAAFLGTFILTVVCSAIPAAADPVRVTAGVVEAGFGPVGEPWNAEVLQLTAPGFSIGSSLEDEVAFVQLTNPPTIAPGALVDFSGVLRVEDVIGALVNDSFALVTAPFSMSFAAAPARLACGNAESLLECSGVAAFTFEAELTLSEMGGAPFTERLIGSGTVEGRLFRSGAFESGAVSYVFEPTPTPEPATLSLFTTGALLWGGRVWRRRRAVPPFRV